MRRFFNRAWLVTKIGFVSCLLIQCTGIQKELNTKAIPYNNSPEAAEVYLRVHMQDGTLFHFEKWVVLDTLQIIEGKGMRYDRNRHQVEAPPDSVFSVPLSDIALFETNQVKRGAGSLPVFAAMAMAPSAIVTIICIVDPKACFGSCPTFYAWDGTNMKLMAEGFSSSIAKVFEESDIDMLYHARAEGNVFTLRLTNEALESHAVKFADLFIVPRKNVERVFATSDGEFFVTDKIVKPSACIGPEGNCLEKVLEMDQTERYSTTDPENLLEKETLEITFVDPPKGEYGLIIGSRQTFLTTFLFYQGMAYAGSKVPYLMAEVERGNKKMQGYLARIWDMLGPIEIFVQNNSGKWVKTGEITEMGPIAADNRIIRLPDNSGNELKVRLRMTKGLWRIDQLGLVPTDRPVEPERLHPYMVLKDSVEDQVALAMLLDTTAYLVTEPGDAYDLFYKLPGTGNEYEFFLFTRGYYLEWMREQWLAEEDLHKLFMMCVFPRHYLKSAAHEFKIIEPGMEEMFWNSRYVKN
ncbi:MAG: hypothetical protein KBC43_10960 [Bacteroidales bacterium]|nr:hypothetical protein [Bacteroidales bacterium]